MASDELEKAFRENPVDLNKAMYASLGMALLHGGHNQYMEGVVELAAANATQTHLLHIAFVDNVLHVTNGNTPEFAGVPPDATFPVVIFQDWKTTKPSEKETIKTPYGKLPDFCYICPDGNLYHCEVVYIFTVDGKAYRWEEVQQITGKHETLNDYLDPDNPMHIEESKIRSSDIQFNEKASRRMPLTLDDYQKILQNLKRLTRDEFLLTSPDGKFGSPPKAIWSS